MRVPRRSGTVGIERSEAVAILSRARAGVTVAAVPAAFVGNIYGKQVKDRDGQAASEVLDPQGATLHALWSSSGRLPQVRALPDLFPEAGRSGVHPRCEEGKLVTTGWSAAVRLGGRGR